MDKIASISNILVAVAMLVVWISFLIIMLFGFILGRIYKKKFFSVVKETVKVKEFKLEKCVASIRNGYSSYRRHRIGFTSPKIVFICQDFASDIRRGKTFDIIEYKSKDLWADRLEEAIERIKDEEAFNDEKANSIIDLLNKKVDDTITQKVKQNLVFLEAYHKGIISVKDTEIQELKSKIQRKQWIVRISSGFGIIGSLVSIISFIVSYVN